MLANCSGNYSKEIQQLLHVLPTSSYVEIDFEQNQRALYQLFDIFIHVPISPTIEAFGQTYVEALAARATSIFTLSGIANEFVVNEENAIVVPYKDSNAIYKSILHVLKNNSLAKKLSENGLLAVKEKFEFDKMMISLEYIYDRT